MPSLTRVRALVLGCSLKSSPQTSSSEKLGREVLAALAHHDVEGEFVRVVDHDVKFGVSLDEGAGDAWPELRRKVMDAQILVIATPIWMGQPSSVCKLVLERLDAELSETDPEGRLLTFGKVAGVAVVGNEDGAHHVIAEVFQALNDVGFTIPASGATYWVGEALQKKDYVDVAPRPDTDSSTKEMALRLAHLARVLRTNEYPAADEVGE